MDTVRPTLTALNTAIITAVRTGLPIREAVNLVMESLERNLINTGVLGELEGRRRTQLVVKPRRRRLFAAIDDVVSGLLTKTGMSIFDLEPVRDRYRARASAVVQGLRESVSEEVNETVEQAIRDNLHVGAAIGRVRERMETIGMTPDRPWMIENLIRTQTQIAYGAGRVLESRDPAISEILWGWQYVAVGDDRTRPNHMALDGVRLPKDDPRWNEIMPPSGFNCRCSVIEIFTDDPVSDRTAKEPVPVTINGVTVEPRPDKGFDFNPADAVSFAPV